jgi:hypothetical protein
VTSINFCSFNHEILTTISISSAPFLNASFVSNALVVVVDAPKGKPITVHTLTSEFDNNFLQYVTHVGLTHTDIKSYLIASSHKVFISSCVASGFSNV